MRRALLILSSFLVLPKGARGIAMKSIRSDSLGGQGARYFFDIYPIQHTLTSSPSHLIAGVQLIPKTDTYSKAILWFHGLGDDCDGWSGYMPRFGLSDTKFILPSAQSIPITINGGGKMPGWSVSILLVLTNPYIYSSYCCYVYVYAYRTSSGWIQIAGRTKRASTYQQYV